MLLHRRSFIHAQSGINMVDLMMWLVVAALLLAAALQSIGYYQRAVITYQMKSDATAIRTYMEKEMAVNGSYPNQTEILNDVESGAIKLSGGSTITGIYSYATVSNWAIRICTPHLDPYTKGSGLRFQRDVPNEFDFRLCSQLNE